MQTHEAFKLAKCFLPEGSKHVSGSLETEQSDVDVLVPSNGRERRISFVFAGREFNVLFSSLEKRKTARKHRINGLRLEREFPKKAQEARRLKKDGMGTEPAWAEVLGISGCPYKTLAKDYKNILEMCNF